MTAWLIFWRGDALFGQASWFQGSWWQRATRFLWADRIDWQLTIVFGVFLTFLIAACFKSKDEVLPAQKSQPEVCPSHPRRLA